MVKVRFGKFNPLINYESIESYRKPLTNEYVISISLKDKNFYKRDCLKRMTMTFKDQDDYNRTLKILKQFYCNGIENIGDRTNG